VKAIGGQLGPSKGQEKLVKAGKSEKEAERDGEEMGKRKLWGK